MCQSRRYACRREPSSPRSSLTWSSLQCSCRTQSPQTTSRRVDRRRYRVDRAPRLGGEHPFPAGPLLRGGVAWLGVIQRPGRLAISRASASVSAVLSARACPLHPVGRVWPSSHGQPFPTLRRGAPSHLRCVYGSVRPRTCTVSNGNPVARGRAPALSECITRLLPASGHVSPRRNTAVR